MSYVGAIADPECWRFQRQAMIYEQIERLAAGGADAYALCTLGGGATWRQVHERAKSFRQSWDEFAQRRVGVCLRGDASGLASLAALDALHADVVLVDADLPLPRVHALWQELRLCGILRDGAWLPQGPSGEAVSDAGQFVTILTSGTTGQPKAVRHTWSSLFRPVRPVQTVDRPVWLLSYRPHLYAGLQVIVQAVCDGGSLAVPVPGDGPEEIAELMCSAGVTHASATPSFWRQLITFTNSDDWSRVPLQQITLGGEAVDQQILNLLRSHFPQARITHIYATTELGRCFAVTDGRAGFPAGWLENSPREDVQLRIVDGELAVKSSNRMSGYDPHVAVSPQVTVDDWMMTGDLVERSEDRVVFRGRRSDIINVGGNKVQPLTVEDVIRQLPWIKDARVFGKSSSIAGQIVACQIAVHEEGRPADVKSELSRHCRASLPSPAVPRWIEVVASITLTEAGKKGR